MQSNDDAFKRLDAIGCRQLLGNERTGRIAFNGESSPAVWPVDYDCQDNDIRFTTRLAAVQAAARRGENATFQVDGVIRAQRCAWTVTASGTLELIQRADDDDRSAGNTNEALVRLRVESMEGCQTAPDQGWGSGEPLFEGRDASDLMG